MKLLKILNNKGMIANPITLKNFFESDDNILNEVGGDRIFNKINKVFIGSTRQTIDYAKIIHEMYVKTRINY